MTGFIAVTGPNQAGEFIATMPDGGTSLLIYWEDLEALKLFCSTEEVQGDLLNLSRRTRKEKPPSTSALSMSTD